jgi:glycosyltransferase involved in cell wall biosynthesis
MELSQHKESLVSVIIPCYNHADYLSTAVKSVQDQSYSNYEIIIIDDGSTDNTKSVAAGLLGIHYIFQPNSGLSAARNAGIEVSKGKYLVFLDADDWLYKNALLTNFSILETNPNVAFVSGAHRKVTEDNVVIDDEIWSVDTDHYLHLLQGNYIGMHATVMYQRWVFDVFKYDTTLKACEDYDLYLKISRKYPVLHHQNYMAAYLIHHNNMSGNIPLMLHTVLIVLKRQESMLLTKTDWQCYKTGQTIWKEYYTNKLYYKLSDLSIRTLLKHQSELMTLMLYNKRLYSKLFISQFPMLLKKIYNRIFRKSIPSIGNINLGDLNRTTPFSTQFGYDRGGPVDRYYIENFLERNKEYIKGRVLEIGDNEYTLRFGGEQIEQSDILHIDEQNFKATFIGDLSDAPHLPDNAFDCIVLTQTLHLIYHHQKALETCYRVLKSGGTLLLTVPGISHIDQGEWKDIWLWAFTQSSINKMLSEVFSRKNIEIQTYGNVLVAAAFLYGIGLPELRKSQMDETDPHYQVIITARATKSN